MSKKFAKSFYNSKQWRELRQSYIEDRIAIDGGLCEVCHRNFGYILHHKTKLTPKNIDNPNISINRDNLRWECKACHDREEEHFIRMSKTICSFDENGQPIPPLSGEYER